MARKPTMQGSRSARRTPVVRGSLAQTQSQIGGAPNVQYTRAELLRVLPLYDKVRDCIAGSLAVKAQTTDYLPMPNPTDQSAANQTRYLQYLQRAVFYNVTRRTVVALTGQIFLRDPQIEVPASLTVLELDANGENVTLEQIAKTAAHDAIAYGRAGLLADYPTTNTALTVADVDSTDIRPTIDAYSGRDIINWRKAARGGRSVYTLVVLAEDYVTGDDGFEAKTEIQYRVLRLVSASDALNRLNTVYQNILPDDLGAAIDTAVSSASDVYVVEVWRSENTSVAGSFSLREQYVPRDHQGNFLNEIPFIFIGSEKNDDAVDHPPMADMAELNIAHYCNSADYEESCFITGQPTPYVSGVTEEWNNNVLKGKIQLGSRGVIPLPNGGTAGLLQADPNTLPFEGMGQKERQMVALGAKLVEQRQVQRTATEAEMEGTSDTSILAGIAQNVSAGMQWALKKCCLFTGDNDSSVSFSLNTEFDLTRMAPQERQELVEEWIAGAITTSEMRANFRRGGVATLDDAEFKAEAAKDAALRLTAEVTKTKALANATPQPTQQPGTAPANK